jgi:dipeptidyl aminopeptidase/acylaminoacyl peptidase
MPTKRKLRITPQALLDLKVPSDLRISPSGARVAYTVEETDWDKNDTAQHLYVIDAEQNKDPRQLTRGKSQEFGLEWSPSGDWLAFLRLPPADEEEDDDEEGEGKAQVWLLPMDGLGGEAEKLTEAPQGILAYEWLPDSSGIVYLAREPRPKPLQQVYEDRAEDENDAVVDREEKFRRQIWRIDLEKRKSVLIHRGDLGILEIAVSPDAQRIAFLTNYTGELNDYHQADIWVRELSNGRIRPIVQGAGGKYQLHWSPDGESLFYIQPQEPEYSYSQSNLYSVSIQGGDPVNITVGFDHDLVGWRGYWWDQEGRLYLSAAVGVSTAVFIQEDGAFFPLIQNDEHIHEFTVSPNGSVAYVASGNQDAPELYWLAHDAEETVVLTELNNDWMDQYALCSVDIVSWKSPDGTPVEGLITYPNGYDPELTYPLILSIHGGPHGRAVQSLLPGSAAQVYASDGFVVLSPNYRGSEGYGNAFSTANRGDLGGGDYWDCISGVDWAVAEGIADPERLGIIGSSYGGYLTNWAITQTDRFKAAVSAFGIFSFVTDFSNSEAPRWEMEYLNGPYWEQPELYASRSPATHAQAIQTPILILHGDSDSNTFIANSQEMYTALRLQNKVVQYVRYPREGHGFAEPKHRVDEIRRCRAWFDKYVMGAGQTMTYRLGDKIVQDGWELTVVEAEVASYVGHPAATGRFIEVAFVLREVAETRAELTLGPADVALTRGLSSSGRSGRPVGLPLTVLGQKVLAEGARWRFTFTTEKEERGVTAPIAVTFRISAAGGAYALAVKDFPPITFDIPEEDKDDDAPSAAREGKQA